MCVGVLVGIPYELGLSRRLYTDTFLGHMKTYLPFVRTGVGSASKQLGLP